jgi:hypothetical protein
MKTKNMTTLHLRNSISRPPWRGGFLLIPLVLACFALLPRAQAVTPELLPAPAPDGFYTGFNTAEGLNALFNVNTTVGQFNTALGFAALKLDTTGAHNTAIGAQALLNNNGSFNTAVGENALVHNTTGSMNMALGQGALATNKTGNFNTAMGFQALNANTVDDNTAVGGGALATNSTGGENTATGASALNSNIDGDGNNAFGDAALFGNDHGDFNNAFGHVALFFATGDFNTAVGDEAGVNVSTGTGNTLIGASAGEAVTSANNVICIGRNVVGANTSDRTYIGNIGTFTQAFSAGANEFVTVNLATGRLGHFNPVVSSRRYKEDIKPLDKTSEALFALNPVSYRLKKEFDPTQALAFGLIAEEVEKVNPDLVSRNNKGQVESVRYEMVNAMLLNEFLKEHRKVEALQASFVQQQKDFQSALAQQQKDLQATAAQQRKEFESKIAQQQKQIEALTAGLQKVSAQVEMNKPAPQTVLNNQ